MLALPARAGEVQLTMSNGLVTLTATNATVGEILETWARVGQATIVNGDRVRGGPVTIQLANVPEGEALEIILRSASGFLAAPRQTLDPDLSRFDRIHVLPATSAPVPAAAAAPVSRQPQFPPQFNPQDQRVNQPPNPAGFDQDFPVEDPNAAPGRRGPVFGSFPPPVRAQPRSGSTAPQPATPSTQPGGFPAGVAVPGMVVPAPEDRSAPPGLVPPVPTPPDPR